jgi:hypothetical protein
MLLMLCVPLPSWNRWTEPNIMHRSKSSKEWIDVAQYWTPYRCIIECLVYFDIIQWVYDQYSLTVLEPNYKSLHRFKWRTVNPISSNVPSKIQINQHQQCIQQKNYSITIPTSLEVTINCGIRSIRKLACVKDSSIGSSWCLFDRLYSKRIEQHIFHDLFTTCISWRPFCNPYT